MQTERRETLVEEGMKRVLRSGKIGLVVLLVLLVTPCGAGSAGPPPPLTLDASIVEALEQSLQIRSAREARRGAESSRKEAVTAFLPAFSTTYGYRRVDAPPLAPLEDALSAFGIPWVLPRGSRDTYTWSLDVAQPLFTGGAVSGAYQMAKIGVDIAGFQERSTIQDVVLEVTEAYFTILTAERILAVARQQVERLEAHRDVAQSFYDVGVIPRNDLLFAEVELARGIQNRASAANALELAKARFNTVLRRDIAAPVAVEDVPGYPPFDGSLEECLAEALANRPELAIYRLQVRQAGTAVDVAKSGYFPTLGIMANYSRYGDDPGVSGSFLMKEDDWYVMAVARWRFWEWGKTRHGVDLSRSRLARMEYAGETVRDLIFLDVKNAYLTLRDAEQRIFVAEKAIAQAEENYRLTVERYREQVGTTTEVLDAQTLLTAVRSDYYNALNSYHLALGSLRRSMGTIDRGIERSGNHDS